MLIARIFFPQWCREKVAEDCIVTRILCFLQSLDGSRCASTLKVYAAAISVGHVSVDNHTVESL